ncbi:MAG: hypothetical protein AUI36_35620 [Cyanobacteria bacterium 13_1_40CM_2_61_4]|nr:MAG: hypothetical protein AUI36_35620 [Cyanobacteria bacterium 13_1_40CM_2_61_4]
MRPGGFEPPTNSAAPRPAVLLGDHLRQKESDSSVRKSLTAVLTRGRRDCHVDEEVMPRGDRGTRQRRGLKRVSP